MLFIIAIASFLASFLTFFTGFGLGTILMPIVAVFVPVAMAVAITAFVHLLNNLVKLASLWREVNWDVSLKFGIPALLATIPGAYLLTSLVDLPTLYSYQIFQIEAVITPIKFAVGTLLIIFAVVEWFSFANRFHISIKYLPFGGLLSGFFGGFSGHQGAFRSAFLLHAGLNAKQFVACNAVIASLVDITRLIVYGLNFSLLVGEVSIALLAIASFAALAGVLVGRLGIKKITIRSIQRLVAVLLLIIGLLLIAGLI